MIKSLFLFLITYLSLSTSIAQEWPLTGSGGVVANNSNIYYFSRSTAIDYFGNVYVAYKKNQGLYVSKYSNGVWEQVGGVISTNTIESISLAIHPGGSVYVAYANDGGGVLGVKAYNGTEWIQIGEELTGANLFYKISTVFTGTGVLQVAGYNAWGVPFYKILSGKTWYDVDISSYAEFKGASPNFIFLSKQTPYFAYKYSTGSSDIIKILYYGVNGWAELNTASIPTNTSYYYRAVSAPDGTIYLAYGYQGKLVVKKYDAIIKDWMDVGIQDNAISRFDMKIMMDGTPVIVNGDNVMWFKNNTWSTIGTGFSNAAIDYSLEADRNGNLHVIYQSGGDILYKSGTIMSKSLSTSTLPVTLMSFEGKQNGNGIKLNWNTASETNNKNYTIERSSTGNDFNPITTINANQSFNYTFTDDNPVSGLNFYRLLQVDQNGAKSLLQTIKVDFSLQASVLSAYPNPLTGKLLNIDVTGVKNSSLPISIYDASGSEIFRQQVNVNGGKVQIILDKLLPSGLYIVRIDDRSLKLIVQ